jgi:hypothetical protein
MDDRKEEKAYWHLKEKPLKRSVWRPRFGRVYGPVARATIK